MFYLPYLCPDDPTRYKHSSQVVYSTNVVSYCVNNDLTNSIISHRIWILNIIIFEKPLLNQKYKHNEDSVNAIVNLGKRVYIRAIES
ncbi:hypothetical protein J19TS1_27080 [Heyndrickxia oleronia]|nr:hypothetical protein J19TS1_27080 [Heyndrickxia oleronia]